MYFYSSASDVDDYYKKNISQRKQKKTGNLVKSKVQISTSQREFTGNNINKSWFHFETSKDRDGWYEYTNTYEVVIVWTGTELSILMLIRASVDLLKQKLFTALRIFKYGAPIVPFKLLPGLFNRSKCLSVIPCLRLGFQFLLNFTTTLYF